ncbi:STY4528 family pathogenicity island replication protein [Pseudomonas sp. NPDC089408]|uniref:STY4528 family pathogenicity island replication protein n=1 Tax=unclassified Pseudomonas TaxID=196821 RepID=UPI00381E40B6
MLSFYEVDWQDVVRQCYDALRRRLEWQAAQAKLAEAAAAEAPIRTIYYGDNDPLPMKLLLDRRLTPLERNTWQVLRWLITERRVQTPRYQDLQPYLATSPCGTQASRETIARALNVLRTTRWLSLVERSRDAHGCLRGCVYVLHGDPLTAAEQLELDSGYRSLLLQNITHATKGVRDVTEHVIADIQADSKVATSDKAFLATPPAVAEQHSLPLTNHEAADSERGECHPVRNLPAPARDSESCGKPPISAAVRNADNGRTVQKDKSKKSTVLAHVEFGRARWPEDLKLSPAERRMASQAMRPLEPEQQQAVINEAAVRCARGEIRKPVAYLMGLIKRACRGEFNLWAARSDTTAPAHTPRRPPTAAPEPEPPRERRQPGEQRIASPLALACLEELKLRCRVPAAST